MTEAPPSSQTAEGGVTIGTDELRAMYRTICVITTTGERAAAAVKAGRLKSAFYPVRGLESACAALGVAMRQSDQLVSTYRNLGDAIAKGASLRAVVAELYGRVGGTSKGKGGAMHIHDQDAGFLTSSGIVGAGIPIGVGAGLAAQLDGDGHAVVTTFGDGATSIGAFHESLNMASLWNLPVVFVCQNNQWGEHTAIADYAASTDLAGRAKAYAMPTVKVDGFDPVATAQELCTALERARSGGGPTFVEVVTYRLTGHSGSADYSYVPKDELAKALERDPAPYFRRRLLEEGVIEEPELATIDQEVVALVDDAFAFAEESPQPDTDERYRDVFADVRLVPGR